MADLGSSPNQVVNDIDDDAIRERAATAPAEITTTRQRGSSNAAETIASAAGRLRAVTERVLDANVPVGMWSATGIAVAQAPTPLDIRRGSMSRRESDTSAGGKVRSGSESSTAPIPEVSETRGSRSASSPMKLDKISDEDELPNVFGRPELDNQSFVPGSRTSFASRVPKLAVRQRTSQEGLDSPTAEVFQDAKESPTAAEPKIETSRPQPVAQPSTERFPEYEDSDLDELDPRPKRKSKNVDAMLGRSTPEVRPVAERESSETGDIAKPVPNAEGIYPNGYSFPKPKPWTESFRIGFVAFLRFTFTPLGFLIVLYGLNVVAWGGMLFLLLCNASPAMCHLGNGTYDCNDINSPRRVWVEIDSQILNALFCVTGFGLIPWRFRDLYYWVKWRLGKNPLGLRKLAGYHNGWFRLPHSDHLPIKDFRESGLEADINNSSLPVPLSKTPSPPLTGARATATAPWKLDFVIWAFVWNTFLQAVLSGFMWGLNRYDRPSWSTGLFVALACVVAALGGLVQFLEGKRIKQVEGVPLKVHEEYMDVEEGLNRNDKSKEKSRTEVTTTTT